MSMNFSSSSYNLNKIKNYNSNFAGFINIKNSPKNFSNDSYKKTISYKNDDYVASNTTNEMDNYTTTITHSSDELTSDKFLEILSSDDFSNYTRTHNARELQNLLIKKTRKKILYNGTNLGTTTYTYEDYYENVTNNQKLMYWYLYEVYGKEYADKYLNSDLVDLHQNEINEKAVTAYKENGEIFINPNDLTQDIWDEKMDDKWKYDSIKDLNIDESKKEEIKYSIKEANRLQNSYNLLSDAISNKINYNQKTSKYEITIGESVIAFDNLHDAEVYMEVMKKKREEYEIKYNIQKASIVQKIRELKLEHYDSYRTSESYKEYVSNTNLDEALSEIFSAAPADKNGKGLMEHAGDIFKLLDYISEEEKWMICYLYNTKELGYESADDYYFYIEETVNRRKAEDEFANFVSSLEYSDLISLQNKFPETEFANFDSSLEYSDLIWFQNKFPDISKSDGFIEYANNHQIRDVPGNGVKVGKKTFTYDDPRTVPVTIDEIRPYTDQEKQMYWYLYESKEYGPEVADYYLKYLNGEGDLEDSIKNRFFVDYKSLGDGITSWLEDVSNIFDPSENHSVLDYKKMYILTYLAMVSPELESKYNILEKLGEAIVPGVLAIASELCVKGSGGYVFNILVGIGTMGSDIHISAMEGYTGIDAFLYGLTDGASKAIILTVLQTALPIKISNKALNFCLDVLSDAGTTLGAGIFSDYVKTLMTGTRVVFRESLKRNLPEALEIGLVSAIFNATTLTLEFTKNGVKKYINITSEQASDILTIISSYNEKLDMQNLLLIIAKVTGTPVEELDGEITSAILKGIIKGL